MQKCRHTAAEIQAQKCITHLCIYAFMYAAMQKCRNAEIQMQQTKMSEADVLKQNSTTNQSSR
jgi:hypothetical protein